MTAPTLPHDSEKLLRHRGAMKFIDSLTAFTEDSGKTSLLVQSGNIFLRESGELQPILFTEMIAQSIACHSGYSGLAKRSNPRSGFLVGVRDLVVTGTARLGDRLKVVIEKDAELESMVYVKGVVKNGDGTVCEGILKCWETETAMAADQHGPVANPGRPIDTPEAALAALDPSTADRAIVSRILGLRVNGESGAVEADIRVDPDFIGFNGHFPGAPILPGIMMIQMGMNALCLGFGRPFVLTGIRHAKFMKVIQPGQTVRLSVAEVKKGENRPEFQILVSADGSLCGKISVTARMAG
jgi:3-hydroxyacyl-[acyl-carrier-protein] dehydratase